MVPEHLRAAAGAQAIVRAFGQIRPVGGVRLVGVAASEGGARVFTLTRLVALPTTGWPAMVRLRFRVPRDECARAIDATVAVGWAFFLQRTVRELQLTDNGQATPEQIAQAQAMVIHLGFTPPVV